MITYRLAKASDTIPIAALHAQSWKENYRNSFFDEYLDHHVDADRLDVWSERFAVPNPLQHVIVAENGKELIGFVCTFLDYHTEYGCYLDNLHVRSGNKGLGIGKRLMHESARYVVQQRPLSELYLWVLQKNDQAINVYKKLGGVINGLEEFINPGGGSSMAYRIEWKDPRVLLINQEEAIYQPVNCDLYDHFEIAAMKRTPLIIEYVEIGILQSLNAVIKTLQTKNHEEYLITNSGIHIRLDKVKKLKNIDGTTIVNFKNDEQSC